MDTNGVVTLVYAFPNGTGGNYPPYGSYPALRSFRAQTVSFTARPFTAAPMTTARFSG